MLQVALSKDSYHKAPIHVTTRVTAYVQRLFQKLYCVQSLLSSLANSSCINTTVCIIHFAFSL